MKKLYILFFAMISVGGLFAQDRSRNDYPKNNTYMQKGNGYKNSYYSNDDHHYYGQQQQFQGKDRRTDIDRLNSDYNDRIGSFRHDRYMKPYERDRRIADMQRERDQKINALGKGVIAGAVAGLIAAVLFSK